MVEPNPLALKSGDSVRMVWVIKCVRVECPGVQTKALVEDEYGPCNICGATR